MADTLEIVKAISHVATKLGHDGALDSEGEPIKIGLKREEGHNIYDSRVMDGFGVKFSGNKLTITYHADCKLKDVHDKKFEGDVEDMIEAVSKFLKKEYKALEGKALSLSAIKNSFKADVQCTSRVRCWVQAQKDYTISGVDALSKDDTETPKLDKAIENWLTPTKKAKKPENVLYDTEKNKAEDK